MASTSCPRRDQADYNSLIVVDESLKRILIGNKKKYCLEKPQQPPTPFHGGYQDFLPLSTLREATKSKSPPRTSNYNDLIYYLQYHHNSLELSTGATTGTLFLYKIVASESVLLVQYFMGVLKDIAWQLSRQTEQGVFRTD
jgi:hypothetical protein